MKTKEKTAIHGQLFKKLFVTFTVTTILIFSGTGKAQNTYRIKPDTIAKFTSFSVKYSDNKAYLMWTVINQAKDGYYIIEKSEQPGVFKYTGDVQGIGVPINKNILYCFTDTSAISNAAYRVRHINYDGEVCESNIIELKLKSPKADEENQANTTVFPIPNITEEIFLTR